MRDIKFRTWDNENREMLDVQELNYEYGEPAIRTTMYSDYFGPSDMILMQYTGLKDVNGKEIYEGDIVLINKEKNIKGIVKYSETYAEFIVVNTNNITDEYEPLADYKKYLEILGNEYENPELLEKEGI